MKKIIKKTTAGILAVGVLLTAFPLNPKALTKEETVYSKLNEDGSVKNIYANEKLINDNSFDILEDYTELENIINLNGDEKYVLNNNNLKWNANKNDILYQGTINKSLPISTKVTYKLDNEVMNVSDMLGKKGNVEITIKYTNHDKRDNLYTPFVVTMGTIINSKNNSNITVTNGKIINNGSKNIVVGISTPGLYESLGINELSNLDTIKITYDTTNFELASIYNVITPKIIETKYLKVFEKLDKLYDSINDLQDNMNIINEGADKLANGSSLLKNTLYENIIKLSSEQNLSEKEILEIKNKTLLMVKSMYTDERKQKIAEEAWQQVELALSASSDNTIAEYGKTAVTNALVNYLKSVNEYEDYIKCEIGKAKYEQTGNMSAEEMASCNIIKNDATLKYVEAAATSVATEVGSKTVDHIAEKITKMVAQTVSEKTALETSEQVAVAVSNEVYNTSVEMVVESFNKLYLGITELDNGINSLSLGITKYNQEGINKIYNLANGKVFELKNKLEMLSKLSNNYNSFAGIKNNTKGTTKFISLIDGQKADIKANNYQEKNTKTTLWERIKNLFK